MKTVYVDDTNQAGIICPKCGFEKKINTTNIKNTQRRLKARCKCGEAFGFEVDFREKFRKDVMLPGGYIIQGKGEKEEVIVRDLSLTGIRFETLKPHEISTDDILEVNFKLDDSLRSEVFKTVKVIWVKDHIIGAQFIGINYMKKDLGFYLKI